MDRAWPGSRCGNETNVLLRLHFANIAYATFFRISWAAWDDICRRLLVGVWGVGNVMRENSYVKACSEKRKKSA